MRTAATRQHSKKDAVQNKRNRHCIMLCVTLLLSFFFFTTAHAQQRGKATYYSKRATGARTSDGSRLHHDSLTCAHRTYPFGTMLKVTNLSNGKSVVVKVTDRGPFTRGRIIDLSYRAAREIGMLSAGVAMVELQVQKDNIVPLKPEVIKFQPIEFDMAEMPEDNLHPQWEPQNNATEKQSTAKQTATKQQTSKQNPMAKDNEHKKDPHTKTR